MPARRKSTEALALSGALTSRPGRYANRGQDAARGEGVGRPPKHLTAVQKAIWNELVKVVPAGVLSKSDALILEVALRMIEKMRAGQLTRSSEQTVLLAALGKLGLTPADRHKVDVQTVQPKVEEDPWDAFERDFAK